VDGSGNAYVAGETGSTDFPTTPGAYNTTSNGNVEAFVVKLNATGSTLSYATYLGGNSQEYGYGGGGSVIAVDGSGNAYITGGTYSTDFPTTPGAYDTTSNGGGDVFVVKLDATGSALSYATYLGGSDYDSGWGIAVDGSGNAYVSGHTYSTDFPTTPGAYDTTFNSSYCCDDMFITKFSGFSEVQVSNAPTGDQRFPWVDYNEATGQYLVFWQDNRSGSNDDIYGVRLDQNGNRINSDFSVSTAAGHQQRVLVKAGGGGWLAVWHDQRNQATNGADIYGAWIDGSGNVGPEMEICACPSDQWNPVAGYDPLTDSFLVVWLDGRGSTNNQTGNPNDNYDLYGVIIPAGGSGSLTPFPLIAANNGQRGPQIGYDYENGQYYLAWNDRRSGTGYDIYGARVTTAGTLLNGSGVLLNGAAGDQFRPTVTDRRPASGVSNHLVAWTDYRNGAQADVYGVYVDGNGNPVGSDFAVSTSPANQANVVADVDWISTKKSLVGTIDQSPGAYYNIYTATVDQAGGVVERGPLSPQGNEQRGEVVAYATDGINDYGFLAVWADRRNGTDYDIWGMKVWP
jgi:hypothetical protein